jgi:hypothetical protein
MRRETSRVKTSAIGNEKMGVTRTTPYEDLPDLLRVEEFVAASDTSAWLTYELIRRRELPVIRFGRLLRIPKTALTSPPQTSDRDGRGVKRGRR